MLKLNKTKTIDSLVTSIKSIQGRIEDNYNASDNALNNKNWEQYDQLFKIRREYYEAHKALWNAWDLITRMD